MDYWLIPYNLAGLTAAGALAPVGLARWLAGGLPGRWDELWPRLGLYTEMAPPRPGPRVWLQAVSVGEVGVATAVADEILAAAPQVSLTVSSSTASGLAAAWSRLGDRCRVVPFPLDLPWIAWAAARRIRPQVYASLETELWPNLLAGLDAQGARLLLLNGRISPRSFPRYRRLRSFWRGTLARLDHLGMISEVDARRVTALGVDPERVSVMGNAKYAGVARAADPARTEEPAARLALEGAPLLVAGSVRGGEERPVLEAFAQVRSRFPEAVLAVAPRHVEKAPRWLERAEALGLTAQAWSQLGPEAPRRRATAVVVVDAFGVLMGLYGLASSAFLGASLVPLGGQNPMEPAAWGVPCVFGPSMEDFADAAQDLTEAGAAARVDDAAGLAAAWSGHLARPAEAARAGAAGRGVAARQSGAAAAAARAVLEQLERCGVAL